MTPTSSRVLLSFTFVGTLCTASMTAISCSINEKQNDKAPAPKSIESAPSVVAVPPPMQFEGKAYEEANRITLPKVKPEEAPGLHNIFKLSKNIISGSEPHGEEAIKKISEMGVKTILSVDGKVPDAELAAKYGMKYVHVPIQYKGITDEELTQISKTFREQQGPFFVHCFHGKHRGPAAAEIGRLVLDGIPRGEAIAEMRQWCGTAASYEGLYKTIAVGSIPSEGQTRSYDWNFPSAQPLTGIGQAMTIISRADDNLKDLSKHQWQAYAEHPDADALNEAIKLASALERANQLVEVAKQPENYRKWMADSATQSVTLRDTLKNLREGKAKTEDVDNAYKALSKTCSACHDSYRNN